MNTNQKFDQLQSQQQNGVFYPQDYTVAVFTEDTNMNALQQALADAGWPADTNLTMSGQEFLLWHRQNEAHKDTLQKLQSMVAELAGQETEFVKMFITLAEQGHQFLIIHTPTPEDDERMIAALREFSPVKLSDYRIGSIVDLEVRHE